MDGIATILRAISPDEPEQVSQSAFDARRGDVPGMPVARVACQRLELDWETVRRIALMPPRQRSQGLGIATRRAEAPVTSSAVTQALRRVAEHLGVSTLRPSQYVVVQEDVEARGRRAWRHGRDVGPLPTLNQITHLIEWEAALKAAGLAPSAEAVSQRTAEHPEAVALAFIEEFGSMPTTTQLMRWAKLSGIAMARFSPKWTVISASIAERRAADGLPALDLAPRDLELDPKNGAPRAPGATVRGRNRWDHEAIIEGIAVGLGELRSGQRLTQRNLAKLARGRPDIPSPAILAGHKIRLDQAIREAEELRRSRR